MVSSLWCFVYSEEGPVLFPLWSHFQVPGARELLVAISDCLKPADGSFFLLLLNFEACVNTLLLRQMFVETVAPSCCHCLLPFCPDNISYVLPLAGKPVAGLGCSSV